MTLKDKLEGSDSQKEASENDSLETVEATALLETNTNDIKLEPSKREETINKKDEVKKASKEKEMER